jgi:predicted metal-dependent hydrolase
MMQEVIYDEVSNVIAESIHHERQHEVVLDAIHEEMIGNEIVAIVNNCINEEVAQDEYDGIIDKIIEMDIWRGTVKELR